MKHCVTLLMVVGALLVGCRRQEPPTPLPPTEELHSRAAPAPLPAPGSITKPAARQRSPAPIAPAAAPVTFETLEQYVALDQPQRMAAVAAVATRGPEEAASKLAELFRVEPSAAVKTAILDELGFLEHAAALKPVLATLETNQPEEVRDAAIDAAETLLADLADAENPAAFNSIVQALDPRYPQEVREAAITALEDLEDPRALPHLQRLLTDNNPDIRQLASDALDWLKE